MNSTTIWQELTTELKWHFESNSETREFKRGDFIYKQGESPKGLYFVKSGLIGFVILGSTGKEHLLRFFRTGQFFGHRSLFSQEGYHGSTVALEPTTLKFVPKDIILSAIEKEPGLLRSVVTTLSKELRRAENHQVMILDNQILVRVAQTLIYLKDLHPQHNWTRQEIANFCASTVSTVIKALAELEDLKLIKQDGRFIEILDRNAIVAMQDKD